jgi:hypothetical protein
VLDAGNPNVRRDGPIAEAAVAKGGGLATAEHLPGARIVRGFNQLNFKVFLSEAHRAGERVAVPLASDDKEALAVVSRLVTDAGFEPVVVGPLAAGKSFDRASDLPESDDGPRAAGSAETALMSKASAARDGGARGRLEQRRHSEHAVGGGRRAGAGGRPGQQPPDGCASKARADVGGELERDDPGESLLGVSDDAPVLPGMRARR